MQQHLVYLSKTIGILTLCLEEYSFQQQKMLEVLQSAQK
jgi:hypothetical protein